MMTTTQTTDLEMALHFRQLLAALALDAAPVAALDLRDTQPLVAIPETPCRVYTDAHLAEARWLREVCELENPEFFNEPTRAG